MVSLLFLFDMDDVLYDYDWRTRMSGLTALTGHDLHELRRRWWNDEGEWAAEAGRFADAESYHRAFVAALGVEVSVQDWVDNRRSAMTAWPESIAAVRRASELGDISLLTNNGPLVGAHLATIAPEIASLFGEHLRTSSYYGARKPDPVVFDRVLEAYGADSRRRVLRRRPARERGGGGLARHHRAPVHARRRRCWPRWRSLRKRADPLVSAAAATRHETSSRRFRDAASRLLTSGMPEVGR